MRREAAALGMAVLALVAGAVVGFGEEFRAISFQSNGDLIQGWYWLRDPGLLHKAWWTFEGLPKDTDLVLEITCLATSRVNGPRGVSAQFLLVYGFGDAYVPKEVTLPNVSPPEDSVGYTCRGTVVIPANTPGLAVGKLTIFVQRISAGGPHVAFNKDSMVLRVSQPPVSVVTGYLFSIRQAWGTRSEGPLYLLQTQEFNVGLEGFLRGGARPKVSVAGRSGSRSSGGEVCRGPRNACARRKRGVWPHLPLAHLNRGGDTRNRVLTLPRLKR